MLCQGILELPACSSLRRGRRGAGGGGGAVERRMGVKLRLGVDGFLQWMRVCMWEEYKGKENKYVGGLQRKRKQVWY